MTKKFTFIFCLVLLFAFSSYSQTNLKKKDSLNGSQKRNELKYNIAKSFIFKGLDLSYERLLDEDNAIGLEVFISLRNKEGFEFIAYDFFDRNRTFTLEGFYRRFFSKGYAKGFFTEGFLSLNQGNEVKSFFISDTDDTEFNRIVGKDTDLVLGVSIGGKFVISKRIVAEIYCGVGAVLRNLDETRPRGGISLGYRF